MLLLLLLSALIPAAVMFPAALAQGRPTLQSCVPSNTQAYEQVNPVYPSQIIVPAAFTFTFNINNPGGQTNVGLGITLTDPSGRPWNDVSNDIVVPISHGSNSPYRSFVYALPTPGDNDPSHFTAYSVTCAIWSGQPGYSTWWDSNWRSPITVYVSSGF